MPASNIPRRQLLLPAAAVLLAAAAGAQEALVDAALQEQLAATDTAQRAQAQVERLADETAELLAEYRVASQSLDRVRIYNGHLQTIVADQEREKAKITAQLENFGAVEQEIVPLMMRMIEDLGAFVELDLPFQLAERRGRVGLLRELMDRADVSIAEKYRRIMEAYTIEANFGRNIEAYEDWIERGGDRHRVDFLRVGRIFLGYQTNDRAESGFFNSDTRAWEPLGEDYRRFITQGLRIARKQAAPDLLKLPVRSPEPAQ